MVKDSPLSEIILRKYERPYNLEKRQLVRKICLSLGLLQLGDGRDVIVDILMVLIDAGKVRRKLSSEEIGELVKKVREENNLELKGLAESNVRRQLKRLRDLMIIEKQQNVYFLSEFESPSKIFESRINKFLIEPTVERIGEYLGELDK